MQTRAREDPSGENAGIHEYWQLGSGWPNRLFCCVAMSRIEILQQSCGGQSEKARSLASGDQLSAVVK
jgi:hypothetical protein